MTPSGQVGEWPRRRAGLGLSFSGGGFRATAFSLGTLALLQDLGLLAKAKVMSSVSGGSLALAAYVCAKAGSDASREEAFRFDECFYRPLMAFLEGERLAKAFVNVGALLRGEKLVLKAADATHQFLNELLNWRDDANSQEAILGNEKITEMLANDNLSPDFVFINATNIASLDLFRFGIERGQRNGERREASRPIFVLNRFFLKHSRDSAEGKTLYHYAQTLRLADCVAASYSFPAGFEPLIFPDDFFRARQKRDDKVQLEQAKRHFRGDLICDHKKYLAFLDGGLYDNLGLASVEDIRGFLQKLNQEEGGESQPIHYIIATDVDQIPTQYTHYRDGEIERLLKDETSQANGTRRAPNSLSSLPWILTRFLVASPFLSLLFIANILASIRPLKTAATHLIPKQIFWNGDRLADLGSLLVWVILALILVLVLAGVEWGLRKEKKTPRKLLSLSSSFPHGPLHSWLLVGLWGVVKALTTPQKLWQVIYDQRMGQLLPAFSGYLKRTRSLTYGYLQQAYKGLSHDTDCHLIRNMIFELAPGEEVDPDYATNLITLPIQDYRSQEKLNPVSPIARKITHASYVSTLLQQNAKHTKSQAFAPGSLQLSVEEIDLGIAGRWSGLSIEPIEDTTSIEEANPANPHRPLMLRLISQGDGELLREARRIIDELNLDQADHIWRWLCNHLACFDDDSASGCGPAHPETLSLPIGKTVVDLHDLLRKQVLDNKTLLDRCLVSMEETTSSYSWIPLICEMATNLPTTLWLKDVRWYVPNRYNGHQRIQYNGKWFVEEPRRKDLKDYDLIPLDLGDLGPAPAAAVCAVAGYASTCFNLLEFFYSWLGNCDHARRKLLALLKQHLFPFESKEDLRELEDLPYPLRHWAWNQLTAEARQGRLDTHILHRLPLLEYPLNRRNGMPESSWAGRDED